MRSASGTPDHRLDGVAVGRSDLQTPGAPTGGVDKREENVADKVGRKGFGIIHWPESDKREENVAEKLERKGFGIVHWPDAEKREDNAADKPTRRDFGIVHWPDGEKSEAQQ